MYRGANDELFTSAVITDQNMSEFEITSLEAGRYEVRIAAFDTEGLYSDYSEPAFADIGI
jgi:hypothetical protein